MSRSDLIANVQQVANEVRIGLLDFGDGRSEVLKYT
jgi:hypothetical protein